MARPFPLDFKPGVQRDGTRVDSDMCIAALWTRFCLNRPRKMAGMHLAYEGLDGIARQVHMFYIGEQVILHVGTAAGLQQVILNGQTGAFISAADRTPAAFTAGPNVGWTLDAIFDTTSAKVVLLAHATPDLTAIAESTKTLIFYGDITATSPLTPLSSPGAVSIAGGTYSQPRVSGGVCCVQPYVFDFDSDGFIGWSAPNKPTTLGVTGGTSGAGQARQSAQKIVAGAPLRGGGVNSPAAIFWSLTEVIIANFIGGAPIWAFNTLTTSSSILSHESIVEDDGIYYWIGIDRFLVYNGSLTSLRNDQNSNWFFENMNWKYAAKCFAFKVPRYGEIWFCAPLFGNTEPSHAVIYNKIMNCWYDTELPDGGRTAAHSPQGFRFPVMGGVERGSLGYKLWLHEYGKDKTGDGIPLPVRSYFETPFMGGPMSEQPTDQALSIQQIEPDIEQTGDMTVHVIGGANPKAAEVADPTVPIKAIPTIPQEQIPGMKTSRRYARLHFEMNCLNGFFQFGRSLVHGEPAESKLLGTVGTPLTEDQP